MKTIPDFAVSSQEAGFDKFLKVYNEYFKFDFFGNAKFYGAKNGENYQTGQAWITPITPSEAIALLTGKQLTEGELIGMEAVIKKRYPFYDPNIAQKDIEIDSEAVKYLMGEYTAHLQNQLNEAKELLTLFADAKGVYQDNINKANQFLTRKQ